MNDPVMIRLEVDYMKHSIIRALQSHHAEIEARVSAACDAFISSGELDRQVSKAVEAGIEREISAFFGYGGPGMEAIRSAVGEGMSKLFGQKK